MAGLVTLEMTHQRGSEFLVAGSPGPPELQQAQGMRYCHAGSLIMHHRQLTITLLLPA